jgi:hypothetical protein
MPQFDEGPVPDTLEMTHMYLVLRRSAELEDQLIGTLHNPRSADYRR